MNAKQINEINKAISNFIGKDEKDCLDILVKGISGDYEILRSIGLKIDAEEIVSKINNIMLEKIIEQIIFEQHANALKGKDYLKSI